MNLKRYYPDVLSPEHRVLTDYFQGRAYSASEQNRSKGLAVATGILLLVASPFTIAYKPFFLMLAVTGLLLLPSIGRMVASALRIRLTTSVRKITLIVLLILNLPFAIVFGRVASRLAENHRIEQVREQQASVDEQQRKDSLDVCLQRINVFQQQGETNNALMALDKADLLTKTLGESADVNKKRIEVSLAKATDLMNKRQYNMAIDLLNGVYELDTNDTEILYKRALCYVKTNHIAHAAHDAKRAMLYGHCAADTLHERINPIRKRVAYYTTQCRDGSFSSATGRGACSHHGGVANWNYPVFESYRQYE